MVAINVVAYDGSFFPHVSIGVLSRTVGQHDCFQLITIGMDDAPVATTAPLMVSWVDAAGTRTDFYGYLDVQTPTRSPKVGGNTYAVMGSSYVMRNGHARVWQKRLAHEIFLEVLAPYKLAAEYDGYDSPIEFFSQAATESDWQTLVSLAERIGYSLAMDGSVVRFVDSIKESQRAASQGMVPLQIPGASPIQNAVVGFSVKSTTTPTGMGYMNYAISGVDRMGQRFSYQPNYSPVRRQDTPPEVTMPFAGNVSCLQDAMTEADRINKLSRWTQQAEMTITGKTDVIPSYSLLVGDDSKQYGGYWHVTETHLMIEADNNKTTTEVRICRDTAAAKKIPSVNDRGPRPLMCLVQGAWQADRYWVRALS